VGDRVEAAEEDGQLPDIVRLTRFSRASPYISAGLSHPKWRLMTILLVRALAGRDFSELRTAKEVVSDISWRDRIRVELWDLIDLLEELVVLAR
jgi:hypothetical protein